MRARLAVRIGWSLSLLGLASLHAAELPPPAALTTDGVPPVPLELVRTAGRYLEFRTAGFLGWHPRRREMLISTRFAETPQLHWVDHPMGSRQQLTFTSEPITSGEIQPGSGSFAVYSQDSGGGEFFQLHRLDLTGAETGKTTLLTDGRSWNTGLRFSHSGEHIAFSSTRRNGRDSDLWVMNPAQPDSAKLVLQVNGGGWSVGDWSPDGTKLAVLHQVSINEASLHLLDIGTGILRPVHDTDSKKAAFGEPRFNRDGSALLFTSDRGSEFLRLFRRELSTGKETVLTPNLSWDVEAFEPSPDGRVLAVVVNEDTSSVLRLLDAATGKPTGPQPRLPLGVLTGLRWHENGVDLGFSISHANSPSDAYSFDRKTGTLTRWTRSETGGVDASRFPTPVVERTKSFDGLTISSLVYRPDPVRFPGKRPVLMVIHGGPESESRPIFQGRYNYHVHELGVALVVPNVRGSAGYGKTFLTLDNGFRREDSVKDIGAVLDWIKAQPDLDGSRIGVTGGSYGGYMTLATLTHYSDRVRCGVDVVGISNFVTFLESTQEYRRDLRRVEYGDERDPAMRKHLLEISPSAHADRIRVPLMVVQGRNDPRVPVTESIQMVKAVRAAGGTCAYLEAADEGHGFQKKRNADYQFFSSLEFWRKHLLGDAVP